jgi:integrase/recombinase XerC
VQENVQEPWFRKQTWSWYVELPSGRQVRLGKHPSDKAPTKGKRGWNPPDEILDLCRTALREGGHLPPEKDPLLAELFDDFISHCDQTTSPETRDWYLTFLQDFKDRHPKLRASQVTEDHVTKWLNAKRARPWGQSTRRSAVTILKRAFNWAVKVKPRRLEENPIASMERPAATRRERVLSEEEKTKILGWYAEGDVFRDFLVAMMESGCRPGEIMKVEAKDVSLAEGTWTLHGKTTRATGRKRIVYLTPVLLEITRRLMAERPEGAIFRNEDGNPWTRQAVNCRFRRKKNRKKLEALPRDVVAYTYRATWATDALENEVPDATVAELMGHRDTQMVHRHYSKLNERRTYLRKAAEKAVKRK